MKRIGLVVHPTRRIATPLAGVKQWAGDHGVEVVQIQTEGVVREVAPFGDLRGCDLVVAIGGDGTVLAALRAAAETGTPVLGVACGSLGALTSVQAGDIAEALDQFHRGTWSRRRMHALEITVDGQRSEHAINDVVLVRRGAGQLIVDVSVDGELYARMAGDGVIVATGLGSSAYSMAAGGPVLVEGIEAFVVTPLVIHGGSIPPLVVRAGSEVVVVAQPGYGGFDVEVDGQTHESLVGKRFVIGLIEAKAPLVTIEDTGLGLTALRHRGLLADSPRVLARDRRDPSPGRS
jgi:NAD+ kinase